MPSRILLALCLAGVTVGWPPSVFAQGSPTRSSSLVKADPKAQYYVIKRTMQQFYDSGTLKSNVSTHPADPYDLHACGASGADFLGRAYDDSEPVAELANLAARVVLWRSDLRKIGYPESVWRPVLIEFEDTALPLLGGPSSNYDAFNEKQSKRIAATLNKHRRASNPGLREIVIMGGCGAGEIGIKVTTEPRNGQLLFIPVFFHELCKAQRFDPDDPRSCDRWREAVDGVLFDVAGDYFYRAQWPDGAARRGRLSFTNLKDGQTVVFRKQ
jgi:hypothetical protein